MQQGVPSSAVEDLSRAHRVSTRRQYESGWKKFQRFVRARSVVSITPQVLLGFASYVFRSGRGVSSATVNNAMVSVRDPVKFGFGVEVDPRKWELLKASFFLQRPSRVPSPPSWSLPGVLDLLQSDRFLSSPSGEDLLLRALFLVALATGHRVSQLGALLRTPEFTKFAPGMSAVTLSPKPSFLAKNEREGHRVRPVTIPAWTEGSSSHPLCPVSALAAYVDATRQASGPLLWVDPRSLRPLRIAELAKGLTDLVRQADPSADVKAHHVRKYASSLAFFRSFDVDAVRQAGQWSSSASFVSRYLVHHLRDVPCVALGSVPGPS